MPDTKRKELGYGDIPIIVETHIGKNINRRKAQGIRQAATMLKQTLRFQGKDAKMVIYIDPTWVNIAIPPTK